MATLDLNTWPGPVVAFYLGRITAEQVTSLAKSGTDAKVKRQQVCEAAFYVAQRALIQGDSSGAYQLLQDARGVCAGLF